MIHYRNIAMLARSSVTLNYISSTFFGVKYIIVIAWELVWLQFCFLIESFCTTLPRIQIYCYNIKLKELICMSSKL